jgi:hypothetical protein
MMTYEDIKKANKQLETVNIKGKDYVQVNERVKAFRMVCPGGRIETEMVFFEEGRVIFKATVCDGEGQILATGYSEEREGSTMINRTSFVENCETSAVGRALGFAGIGIDASMASAEEVATAIVNQDKPRRPAPPVYPPEFMAACKVQARGTTLGKLYKEDRNAFTEVTKEAVETRNSEQLAACQTIVRYMEAKNR